MDATSHARVHGYEALPVTTLPCNRAQGSRESIVEALRSMWILLPGNRLKPHRHPLPRHNCRSIAVEYPEYDAFSSRATADCDVPTRVANIANIASAANAASGADNGQRNSCPGRRSSATAALIRSSAG